ncbi:MAG: TolC family protein [Bacteroidales bacterium]
MRKLLSISVFLLLAGMLSAQNFMSLDTCYARLERNYPLMKNAALVSKAVDLKLKSLNTNYLPQLSLGGQASWQSDVPEIDPGIDNPMFDFDMPEVPKDQYKLNAELSQVIWDGGATSAAREIESAAARLEKQNLRVTLYSLRKQVNELFYTILLLQEQINVLEINKAGVNDKLDELETAVSNDMIIPAATKELRVHVLDLEQQVYEAEQALKTTEVMLELLTGEDIPELSEYLLPARDINASDSIGRPELEAFSLQKEQLKSRKNMLTKERYPTFAAFAQAGYARPGLNMFSDSFEPFAILGLKFSWTPWEWNKTRHEKQIVDLNMQKIDHQKEAFLQSVNSEAERYLKDIRVNENLMSQDEEIIELRKDIRLSKESQFSQGSITASEYLEAVNREATAKVKLEMHRIKKSQAIINYVTVTGKNKDNYESNQ